MSRFSWNGDRSEIREHLYSQKASFELIQIELPQEPTPGNLPDELVIASASLTTDLSTMFLETAGGNLMRTSLPGAVGSSILGKSPVIYLDQNHWSTLSLVINSPEDVPSSRELAAGRTLIQMAMNGDVMLPLSSAHIQETGQWSDRSRRCQLAVTMLQLSQGWQMFHPLNVRRRELQAMLLNVAVDRSSARNHIFTLEAHALQGEKPPMEGETKSSLIRGELRIAVDAVIAWAAHASVLMEAEHLDKFSQEDWAKGFQPLTDEFAKRDDLTPSVLRQLTDGRLFNDTKDELIDAYKFCPIPIDLSSKGPGIMGELSHLPALGLWREYFHDKITNPRTRWTGNDMNDAMFLSCAAGYADLVVGERSTIGYLRQGLRRLKRDDIVFPNISSLLDSDRFILAMKKVEEMSMVAADT